MLFRDYELWFKRFHHALIVKILNSCLISDNSIGLFLPQLCGGEIWMMSYSSSLISAVRVDRIPYQAFLVFCRSCIKADFHGLPAWIHIDSSNCRGMCSLFHGRSDLCWNLHLLPQLEEHPKLWRTKTSQWKCVRQASFWILRLSAESWLFDGEQ